MTNKPEHLAALSAAEVVVVIVVNPNVVVIEAECHSATILTSWYCKAINGKARPGFLLNQNCKGKKSPTIAADKARLVSNNSS